MKKCFLLSYLAVILMFSMSCKKSAALNNFDGTPYSGAVNLLYGKWELRSTYGTSGSCQNATYTAGNGNMWKFSDAGYEEYEKNQLLSNGRYILLTDSCSFTGKLMEAIVLPESNYLKMYCDLSRDSLILYRTSGPNDVSIARFVRIIK
jgi:hypothetical protein